MCVLTNKSFVLSTGAMGLNLGVNWYQADDNSDQSIDTIVDRAFQFDVGIFADVILKTGDYPAVVRDTVLGRLTILPKTERDLLKGK